MECQWYCIDLLGPHQLHSHGEGLIEESNRAGGSDQPERHVGPVVRHEGARQGPGGRHQDTAQHGHPPPVLVRDKAE